MDEMKLTIRVDVETGKLDGVVGSIEKLGKSVKKVEQDAVKLSKSLEKSMLLSAKNAFDPIVKSVSKIGNAFKNIKFTAITNAFKNISPAIKSAAASVLKMAGNFIKTNVVMTATATAITLLVTAAKNLRKAFVNDVTGDFTKRGAEIIATVKRIQKSFERLPKLISKVGDVILNTVDLSNNELSQGAMDMVKNFVNGVEEIVNKLPDVVGKAGKLVLEAITYIQNGFLDFQNGMDTIKIYINDFLITVDKALRAKSKFFRDFDKVNEYNEDIKRLQNENKALADSFIENSNQIADNNEELEKNKLKIDQVVKSFETLDQKAKKTTGSYKELSKAAKDANSALDNKIIEAGLTNKYDLEAYKAYEEYQKNLAKKGVDKKKALELFNAQVDAIRKKQHEEEVKRYAQEAKKYTEAQKKKAEEAKKVHDQIAKATMDEYEYKIKALGDELNEFHKKGATEVELQKYYNKKMAEIEKEHNEKLQKQHEKEVKLQIDALKKIGNIREAAALEWSLKEAQIRKTYADRVTKDELAKIIAKEKEAYNIKVTKELAAAGDIQAVWQQTGMKIYESINDAFTKAIMQGKNFVVSMKSLATEIIRDFTAPITKAFAGSISKLFTSVLGVGKAGYTGQGILGAATQLLKGHFGGAGSALMNGISGAYYAGAGGIDNIVGQLGLGGFNGTGIFSNASIGMTAMSSALGMGGGMLLDKLFGTSTHAANYGKWGAGIGTLIGGPIGGAIGGLGGALVGGLFGKKKFKGTYIKASDGVKGALDDLTETLTVYDKFTKKGWFSKSTNFKAKEMTGQLKDFFDGIDKMFEAANKASDVVFGAGKKRIGFEASDFADKMQITDKEGNITPEFSKKMGMEMLRDIVLPQFKMPKFTTKDIFSGLHDFIDQLKNLPMTMKFIDFNAMYDKWEAWAEKQGMSVQEAITAGLMKVGDMIKVQDAFNADWFNDVTDPIVAAGEKMKAALADFRKMAGDLDVPDLNLKNFTKKLREAMQGIQFNPEDIASWQQLQESLQNAAVATKAFSDALGGVVEQYDAAIEDLNKMQLDFLGVKAPEPQAPQFKDVVDAVNAVKTALDNNSQLKAVDEFKTVVTGFRDDIVGSLKDFANLSDQKKQDVTEQVQQMIATTMPMINQKIEQNNEALKEAIKNNDQKAVADLQAVKEGLEKGATSMTEVAQQLAKGGLTEDLVPKIVEAVNASAAQMVGQVKEDLTAEKGNLETLIQQSNNLLGLIEGNTKGMTPEALQGAFNQALAGVQENLGKVATANDQLLTIPDKIQMTMAPMAEGLDAIPAKIEETMAPVEELKDTIPAAIDDAMTPVNEMLATVPEQFQDAVAPIGEVIDTIPDRIDASMAPVNEAVTALPGQFEASMAPVIESVQTLPGTLKEAITPMVDTIAQIGPSITQAVAGIADAIAGSLAGMVDAANETTAAVYSVGNQIAGAIGGLGGSLSSLSSKLDASISNSQAAINAANAAAEKAAEASAANNELASNVNTLTASINIANQTTAGAPV